MSNRSAVSRTRFLLSTNPNFKVRNLICPVFRLAACLIGLAFAIAPAFGQTELADRIRYRLETASVTDSMQVMDEILLAHASLQRLYAQNNYAPLWLSSDGPSQSAEMLVDWIATEPVRHGLRPGDYHVAVLDAVDDIDRAGALVDFELAISDAYLVLASHLLAGRVNPETLDTEWRANRRHRDLVPVILEAAASPDPGASLIDLLPDDPGYGDLVAALDRLRSLQSADGWHPVADGPTLRTGDRGQRVAQVAGRLLASGDYNGSETELFDASLEQAVARFQSRHGLDADGVVGRATLAALNVSVQERIEQIIVNLERWRWLPEDLGDSYVLVNIAGFSLDVIENKRNVTSMRVVVGLPYRRTPVFSGQITYLVFNPYWEVPTSIAVKDKLPLIKDDPEYLERNGYALLNGWGAEERRVDPQSIDWQNVTPANFRYRLRQSPGPLNALGRVKFMFPNEFSVYLHDTPGRELFGRESRTFSSGCIRVERPLELARWLLRDTRAWGQQEIDNAIASGRERVVMLPVKVPVHLLYWTAWVDQAGTLHFRDDIYGRDARVLASLKSAPPED